MFEGVRQLLLGYLGRYIKDIQKEQLKIGLWNGEVLLENVELILEAFDYLQLPFAIKHGSVGRLSIKIPWKKLGWEPIIIVLEDVLIRACQRNEDEWSFDLVEKREFAAKRAKLAAAELAKLSRRVCNNQTGQSFISYITAKILDGIQLSIRNVHIIYTDQQFNSGQFVFGIRFSSLTVMNQNYIGTSLAKLRGGQVSKMLEISGLGVYCSSSEGASHLIRTDDVHDPKFLSDDARIGSDKYGYLMAPFDVAVSLVVNRSGKLENGDPQYSVSAELTSLVIQLNEIQFKQILALSDCLCTSQLREKYGRYRPSCESLLRKPKGWERMWWHYAQESILSDTRKKLRKSSWKHLGWRISYRRKYVQLYKRKLDFLHQEQPVHEDILRELELMEKETDIDDILNYRSIAERDLQELLLSSKSPSMGQSGGDSLVEKHQPDEESLGRSRGWANWLFLGMLGAGETVDSSQFSGVVSDEVVKDIYEATEFNPVPSLDGGFCTKNRILSSVKFNVRQITATLRSKLYDREIVQMSFQQVVVECKHWEESCFIHLLVNALDIVDSYGTKAILHTGKASTDHTLLTKNQPCVSVQVDSSPINSDTELSIKVVLQPFEVMYDSEFLSNLLDWRHVVGSVQSQHERVLLSLNALDDVNVRVASKAEYIALNRSRIIWDISFSSICIKFPLEKDKSQCDFMVLELGSLLLRSKVQMQTPATKRKHLPTHFPSSTSPCDISLSDKVEDLYDHFEIALTDFEVNVMILDYSQAVSVIEKFNASVTLAACIVPDESMMKQMEVHVIVSRLIVNFSSSIYGAVAGLIRSLNIPQSKSKVVMVERTEGCNAFQFSIAANVGLVNLHAIHEDDADSKLILIFALRELDIEYALEEIREGCWVCFKTLMIKTGPSNGEVSDHTLCLSKNISAANFAYQHDVGVGASPTSIDFGERRASFDGFFLLHYDTEKRGDIVYRWLKVCLNEVDLHCYPKVFGLLIQFIDGLSRDGSSASANSGKNSPDPSEGIKDKNLISGFWPQKFGFSNYYEAGSAEACIPVDHFPFITIHNSDFLNSLEESLIHGIPEWKQTLILRDRKCVRNSEVKLRKRSRMFNIKTMNFSSSNTALLASQGCIESDVFTIDLNLSEITAHFHDSSCILGTLTMPISKSLILIHGTDHMDILCSIEGLVLSSSWFPQDRSEYLWGPSEPNLASILNFRARKTKKEAASPQMEMSVSIQHVCCTLPSEFLAIVIGYFALPDWTSKKNEQCAAEIMKCNNVEKNQFDVSYKFEVLDSILILPLENSEEQSLHFKLPQLYCNFTPMSKSKNALDDIPLECMIEADKVAEAVHLLNVFGRGIHVSLMLCHGTSYENFSLLEPLDADFWIRIPCELSSKTCIMMKVRHCEVITRDDYFLSEVEAVLNAIDQLSSVGKESECFRSDVFEFKQLKRSLKEGNLSLPTTSSVTFTQARCSVDLLTVKLYRAKGRHSNSSELVAKSDIKLTFYALFRDDIPLSFNVSFSNLSVYSFHNSVTLVRCTSGSAICSGLSIKFSKSNSGENEFTFCLPSLDIWLYLSDWNEVLDLLLSSTQHLNLYEPSKNLSGTTVLPIDVTGDVLYTDHEFQRKSTSVSSDNIQRSIDLVLKSEDISVSLHYPVLSKEECNIKKKSDIQANVPRDLGFALHGKNHTLEAEFGKYVTFTLSSRASELTMKERRVNLKSNVYTTRVVLEVTEDEKVISWPLFQLNQIDLVAEICSNQEDLFHVTAEVSTDGLEVWLSHQIFHFWHVVTFELPEMASSQPPIGILDFNVRLRKASLVLSDGRWNCNVLLMELLLRNLLFHLNLTRSSVEASVAGEVVVNYNNIQKVMWEPFIEPWTFQLSMNREHEQSALLNTSAMTDIHLKSTSSLNLNLTESLIEVIFRGSKMINDAWGHGELNDLSQKQGFWGSRSNDVTSTRRYSPYILQNRTSLPLVFQVYWGLVNANDLTIIPMKEGNSVLPGCSVPIYIDETPEQLFRYKSAKSSDRLNEKSDGVAHHMISVQFDGTSGPSVPISMDLVGLSYFEVDFSKASEVKEVERNEDGSMYARKIEERSKMNPNIGFVVPVVFDVSVQHYSKLIQLYSTVILLNATSTPLELRFDIPFGVSPKVLDPIFPGQEFPLPLHLAEAGRMRWRPLGNSHLWSEAHLLSNILSQEKRIGILRSFVCYPSHPNNDPFRCCISIHDINLPSSSGSSSSLNIKETLKQSLVDGSQKMHNLEESNSRAIHYVTLTTPLLVRNHLPTDLSLTIESSGVTRTVSISKINTACVFHTDSTHDLGILFHMDGFRPSMSMFPRAETFAAVAKFNETRFSLCETLTLHPDSCKGPLYVTVEKVMDAFCGARELIISVPFLLYNCTGLALTIAESGTERKGSGCIIPSCYYPFEEDQLLAREDGLHILSSQEDPYANSQSTDMGSSISKKHTISLRENLDLHSRGVLKRHISSTDSSAHFIEYPVKNDVDAQDSNGQLNLLGKVRKSLDIGNDNRKVEAFMYSPYSSSSEGEIMVEVARYLPDCVTENMRSSMWSSPFSLVPTTGSTSVVVPQAFTSGAFVLSVTSSAVTEPVSGMSRTITFQPRYVISNACSKDLRFKQKGTDQVFRLGVGQHCPLHLSDTTRDFLVSLCFDEPGWMWSGSFSPDNLGDTQVKMRSYACGTLNMIRVEVQNADVSIRDEKVVGSSHGSSGTNLILLSDDNTLFMPYRIDNFSEERLRIYQQKCEAFETTIHSYTSCRYAWDEPCYSHRLIVEVPGERVLGAYALDDIKEHQPIYLPSTSERPGKRLFLTSHAEGAVKVLSIIDSSRHTVGDMKDTSFLGLKGKKNLDQKQEIFGDYSERISIHLSLIGISLINSYSQELLFACANDTKIEIRQSVDQQKFSFQISSLQIDNQLHNTPYPVILSFDHDNRRNFIGQLKSEDGSSRIKDGSANEEGSDCSSDPIFCLAAAKWRTKDISLVSFRYISLRLAALHLQLEEEVILGLFDFGRAVVFRVQRKTSLDVSSTHGANFAQELFSTQNSNSSKLSKSQFYSVNVSKFLESCSPSPPLPLVVPIGAPWQKIHLLARRQTKIYVELFDLAPIKVTFSFSSVPWMLRNNTPTPTRLLSNVSSTSFQRGLMALADVEGAPVYLKQLTIAHHMASLESFQEILVRHYSRQLLHEMYKVFGSAGVIGNPMGFARNMGLGIKDFLSVPARGVLQSPSELITAMAEGTTSLFSNTIYAVSNAATQFSKAAHKSIVAFTFDGDEAVKRIEEQRKGLTAHNKGLLNEFLEALTGFLQSPVSGAEKHGLPGVLSGIALGTAGLVARPVASILDVTGRTAQSIRNRSSHHQPHRLRARLPRRLRSDLPLRPYSWEEAIGTSMLMETDDGRLKDEEFVMCKALKQAGTFVVITQRHVLVVRCSSLVKLGKPDFNGVAADLEWEIEMEMNLENVIHVDREEEVLEIVGGSSSETPLREHMQKKGTTSSTTRTKRWKRHSTPMPLFHMSIQFSCTEEADNILQVLLSTIGERKARGSEINILHRSNLR